MADLLSVNNGLTNVENALTNDYYTKTQANNRYALKSADRRTEVLEEIVMKNIKAYPPANVDSSGRTTFNSRDVSYGRGEYVHEATNGYRGWGFYNAFRYPQGNVPARFEDDVFDSAGNYQKNFRQRYDNGTVGSFSNFVFLDGIVCTIELPTRIFMKYIYIGNTRNIKEIKVLAYCYSTNGTTVNDYRKVADLSIDSSNASDMKFNITNEDNNGASEFKTDRYKLVITEGFSNGYTSISELRLHGNP